MPTNKSGRPAPSARGSASWPNLWRLSWPLLLTMFLQFSVGLADVYVAGRFSPAAQGAIGFAGQMLFFFAVIANSVGIGLVALISRQLGALDLQGSWFTARQGILAAFLVTVPLAGLGIYVGSDPNLLFFLPPPVIEVATFLLPWYAASLLFQALLTVASAIFRARAEMASILFCSGLAALLNCIGDFLLSFGWGPLPALGPTGIAVATLASYMIGVTLAAWLLLRRGLGIRLWHPDTAVFRRLWRLGWPMGILQLGWHFANLVLYGVLGRVPDVAVAATAALTNGLRIEAILYLPAFALNMIAAVLVGRALGGDDPEDASRTGWRIAGAAALVLTSLAIPVFIYSRELAAVLSPDQEVRHLTHLYLRYNMISQPFMAVSICLAGAMEGAGDTLGVMRTVLTPLWTIRIPLAIGLALFTPLGAVGVWAAMVLSMLGQGIAVSYRYRKGKWRTTG